MIARHTKKALTHHRLHEETHGNPFRDVIQGR